ncbi:MAG: hypothetical protein HY978_05030 [Candidatus Liptonbacteria bacterium]|nr:hypothetical protein [Candidatus Liptonbacteria bacterium]
MGREIAGLPNVEEKFSRLEKGADYVVAAENPRIHSDRSLEDFFVFINPNVGEEKLTIEPPHWRVITWPDVDTQMDIPDATSTRKEPFFSVSTKGVGYLKPSAQGGSIDEYETWMEEDEAEEHDFGYKMFGLSSADDYLSGDVMRKSEHLLSRGLRTEAYWGVAKMERVYYQGELRTIEELKKMGVIVDNPEYAPYQAVRVLKTNDRVEQVYQNDEKRKEIFEHAFRAYNKENERLGVEQRLAMGDSEDEKKFLIDFYRRMGKNFAVLINLGYSHFRLHSSNVTMAAEIVDIGTMGHWSLDEDERFNEMSDGVRRSHIKDLRDIAYSMKYLRVAAREAGLSRPDREQCRREFIEAFKENFDEKLSGEQGTDPAGIMRWIEKITEAVWLKSLRLPALQNYEITDWPV